MSDIHPNNDGRSTHNAKQCRQKQIGINNNEIENHLNAIVNLATQLREEWAGEGCPAIVGTLMFHLEGRVIMCSDHLRVIGAMADRASQK